MTALVFGALSGAPFSAFATDHFGQESAQSLKEILQQAQDHGLITIRSESDGVGESPVARDKSAETPLPELEGHLAGLMTCRELEIFQFWDLSSYDSYEKLMVLKTGLSDLKSPAIRLDLARHYLSLGMGIEAIALTEDTSIEGDKSTDMAYIPVMGRAIEGLSTEADAKMLQASVQCDQDVNLWYMLALSSSQILIQKFPLQNVTEAMMIEAEKLPPILAKTMIKRMALYAAETGDAAAAQVIMDELAPESRHGQLNGSRDEDLRYIFARYRAEGGDPYAHATMEAFAQRDGIYRNWALRYLARDHEVNDTPLYDGFDLDIQSVSQVFLNEKSDTLFADVNIIKSTLDQGNPKEAIAISRNRLPVNTPEYDQAVSMVAQKLERDLDGTAIVPRITAIDVYLSEQDFFETYEALPNLKLGIISAANALDLPELVQQVEVEGSERLMDLTQARIALKEGQYGQVEAYARAYPDDAEFMVLRYMAAKLSGDSGRAAQILDDMPQSQAKLQKMASLSWERGEWQEALANLNELKAHTSHAVIKNDQDMDLKDLVVKSDLARIMTEAPKPVSKDVSGEGLEEMTNAVASDLDTIKGYLSHG